MTTPPTRQTEKPANPRQVCVVGASGKLGRYLVRHCLDRGYRVVGVRRAQSVGKLTEFGELITVVTGRTDDSDVIAPGFERTPHSPISGSARRGCPRRLRRRLVRGITKEAP